MAERQPSIEERIQTALAPEPAPEQAQEQQQQLFQTEAQPTEEVVEAPVEETVEQEETNNEPLAQEPVEEEAVEPTEEVAQETPQEEVEHFQVETLNELAEHIDVDAANLYNLKIPITNANGEREDITMGELKENVQKSKVAKEGRAKANQQIKETGERLKTIEQAVETFHSENAIILNDEVAQLKKDFESINWEKLRSENPTEWNSKRLQFMDREKALVNKRQDAKQKYLQQKKQVTEELAKIREEKLQQEADRLFQYFPQWENRTKMEAEQAEIREYLLNNGYTVDEINDDNGILQTDAKAIRLAYKSMLYDKSQNTSKASKKKIAAIGKKVLKPSAKRTKAAVTADATKKAHARLKKTGKVEDASVLISQRFNRGR